MGTTVSGRGTVVERTPCDHEVAGTNPARCWAVYLLPSLQLLVARQQEVSSLVMQLGVNHASFAPSWPEGSIEPTENDFNVCNNKSD